MRTSSKHKTLFKGLLTGMQGGLNKAVPPYAIGDEQLIDGTNVYYDPLSGYLTTRPGLKKYSVSLAGYGDAYGSDYGNEGSAGVGLPSPIWAGYSCVLGITSYDIIATEEGKLYYLDNDNRPAFIGALLGTKRPTFAVLNSKLVIASGNYIQTWDGDITSALTTTSSPFIDFISDYATKDTARILGVGNATYPDRMFQSGSLDPEDWAFAATPESSAKYADLGYRDGLSINAVGSLLGAHYYFKRNVKGDRKIYAANTALASTNWSVLEATRVNSTISPHFVKERNNKLHFVDIEGPKTVSPQSAWDKPFPVDKSGQLIASAMRPYIADDGFSVVDPVFNLLMIKPGRNVDTWFCLDDSDRWTYFRFVPNIQCGWYNGEKMLLGADDGFVYEYDTTSYFDDGAAYQISAESKWFNKDPMTVEILKRLVVDMIGLTDGSVTVQIKSKGEVKDSITAEFSQGWWDWATVNSITPENWTESLNKSTMFTIEENEHIRADMMSICVIINSGLCSLVGIYADISDAGKGE